MHENKSNTPYHFYYLLFRLFLIWRPPTEWGYEKKSDPPCKILPEEHVYLIVHQKYNIYINMYRKHNSYFVYRKSGADRELQRQHCKYLQHRE
jgi:hypothetical protein